MTITVISPTGLFHVERGALNFQVAFLPGVVAVYGTPGKQYFNNPLNLPPERIREVFPSETMMRKAANLNKASSVDKKRIFARMEILLKEKRISPQQASGLHAVVDRCMASPEKLKQRLTTEGFGAYADMLDIADQNPELDATVEALKVFLEEYRSIKQKVRG